MLDTIVVYESNNGNRNLIRNFRNFVLECKLEILRSIPSNANKDICSKAFHLYYGSFILIMAFIVMFM